MPTLAPAGKFARNAEALPATIPEEEIRRELLAQIALFELKAGRPPTHVDSHHHSALHASVQAVFAAVAQGRGLPVRASSAKARDELRAAGLSVPDYFLEDLLRGRRHVRQARLHSLRHAAEGRRS